MKNCQVFYPFFFLFLKILPVDPIWSMCYSSSCLSYLTESLKWVKLVTASRTGCQDVCTPSLSSLAPLCWQHTSKAADVVMHSDSLSQIFTPTVPVDFSSVSLSVSLLSCPCTLFSKANFMDSVIEKYKQIFTCSKIQIWTKV